MIFFSNIPDACEGTKSINSLFSAPLKIPFSETNSGIKILMFVRKGDFLFTLLLAVCHDQPGNRPIIGFHGLEQLQVCHLIIGLSLQKRGFCLKKFRSA